MAKELGLFESYGLHVELRREVGWATVRDKIIHGELDAAHAPAGTVFAAAMGLGCIRTPCLTGLVLNLHGNAITLSEELWLAGVSDGRSLHDLIKHRIERVVLGVPFPYSTHHFLMRKWLRASGIDPDHDVDVVVVPPPQMYPNLVSGHLDGYCVGEPWNSVAVLRRKGWCVATSVDIAHGHPEKVLMVRQEFADERAQEHVALLAALLEACHFCDQPENRERVIETLALPENVHAPIHALRMSMCGSFNFGHGRVEKYPDFNVFSRDEANVPDAGKADWVIEQMCASGVIADRDTVPPGYATSIFRPDIFHQAVALSRQSRLSL